MSSHSLISRGLFAWIATLFLLAPLHVAAQTADTVRPLASFSMADDVSELGWLNATALGGTNTLRIKLSPVTATGETLTPTDLDTTRVPTVASFTASGFAVTAVSATWQNAATDPHVLVTLTATTDAAGDTSSRSAVSLVANDNAFYDMSGNGSRSTATDAPYVNGLGVISFVGLDRAAPSAGTVTYTPPFAGTMLPLKIAINFIDAVSGVNSDTVSAENFILTSGSNTTTPVATVTVAPDTVDGRIAVYTFTPTTAWALSGTYTLRVNDDVTKRVYDKANSTPFQPATANPMAAGALQLDGSAVTFTPNTLKPTVTDARISLAGASGAGGVYRVGDTVTATWDNTAGGDNNFFAMTSVTMDFRQFGGGATVAATNNTGIWTATYAVGPGTIETTGRNVSVTATDSFAASTTTTADSSNAAVDNQAPAIPSTPVLAAALDTGVSASDRITKTNALYFTGTAGAGSLVTVRRGGVGSLGTVTANGSGGWLFNYTGTPLADGTYTFAATAADTAGNVSGASADLSVTVDNTAPTISLSAPSVPVTSIGPISYTVTYADANFSASTLALGQITLNKTGTADGTVAVAGSGTTRTVTISNITGGGTLGISIAAGTAADLAGNLAPASGASATVSIVPVPAVTNGTLAASGTYGTALSTYHITGSNTPTSYTATGLPAGLSVNTTTGAITGTPTTTVGSPFNVTIGATNAGGTGSATLVLTIEKAPVTVTADAKTRVYGAANPSLTTSYAGFVNSDTAAVLSGMPGLSTTATTRSPVGSYPITVSVGTLAAANYAFMFVNGTLAVTGGAFADWQAAHFTAGELTNTAVSGLTADPDSDGLNNLLEYAFRLTGKVPDTANWPVLDTAGDALTFTYIRRNDAGDLTYTVEASDDLVTWTSGVTVTQQTGATELDAARDRVLTTDLTALSSTTRRFLRLRVNHSSGAVAKTVPLGALRPTFSPGNRFTGMPLVNPAIARDVIASHTGTALTLGYAGRNLGALLTTGVTYFVEVTGGPSATYVGDRFEVDVAATKTAANNTLTLVAGSTRNTLAALPASSGLAGYTVAVRPHVTLGRIFGTQANPLLQGSTIVSSADQVQLLNPQTQAFETYYFLRDGSNTVVQWTKVGGGSTNHDSLPISSGTGMVVLRNAATPVTLAWLGEVRLHGSAQPLVMGNNLVSQTVPISSSPAQRGLTFANGATGSTITSKADNLQVMAGSVIQTYYLLRNTAGSVEQWTRVGGGTTNHNDTVLFTADGAVVINKISADPHYYVPFYFSP